MLPVITFIACHGASANHILAYADCIKEDYSVQIFASEPALSKFRAKGLPVIPISVKDLSSEEEEALIKEIVKTCSTASRVFSDISEEFSVKLQKAFSESPQRFPHYVLYENPDSFVPGWYSDRADRAIYFSDGVFFSNANLAIQPIYKQKKPEPAVINLEGKQCYGIGYFPLEQAQKIALRREKEHLLKKEEILSQYGGERVLAYFGGNNDDYYDNAFPAFLSFLSEAIEKQDLSKYVIMLQPHPQSNGKDKDEVSKWNAKCEKHPNAPKLFISSVSSDEAQISADAALYYQTSMAPQFALAGIPTIHVGHEINKDVLVSANICGSATNSKEFLEALENYDKKDPSNLEKVLNGIGIRQDWQQTFKKALAESAV